MAYEHYMKARLMEGKGLLSKATLELRQALVYDPASHYLHTRLGQLYARQGLWKKASQQASAALRLNPEAIPALMLRANTLARQKKE